MNTIHAMRKLGTLTRILERAGLMQPSLASGYVSRYPQQWKQFLRVPILLASHKRLQAVDDLVTEVESMEIPAKPNPQEFFAFWSALQRIQPKVASGRNIG